MKTISVAISLGLLALALLSCMPASEHEWVSMAPAGNAYTQIKHDGATVIPNGRFITPRGKQIITAPHPYGLTLSTDGKIAITANSGTGPFSVTIIRDVTGAAPQVQQVPDGYKTDAGILASVYMGLAVTPDNATLFVAGGQKGKIYLIDLATGKRNGEIECNGSLNGVEYADSYIGDMVMSADGKRLYAVDQMNFRMLVIDPIARKVLTSVATGRYPFGIALSPDGTRAYVANVGVFVYERIRSFDPKNPDKTSLPKPPFAYGSREMREGIKNDTLDVPGLGDPNVPEAFSVWTVDLRDEQALRVTAKVKTGFLVGELIEGIPAIGGASPNSVVATDRYVFASNGNNDCVSVIDVRSDSVVTNIRLAPEPRMASYRGIIPFGLALSPDGKRLYVAEAGINAVGVIDVASLKVIGHIPAGWFPSKLKVTPDGKQLIVANAKGYGSGPNGGGDADKDPRGTYIGSRMNGFVSVMAIPSDDALAGETQAVVDNNFRFVAPDAPELRWRRTNPIPMFPGSTPSPIKHLVYIVKENRTYDEVFGQVPGGKGDTALARYGTGRTLRIPNGPVYQDITVMPNHHKLAARFALCDNFYCDSDVSADGHRWLSGSYPNEWVEVNVASAYGGGRDPKPVSTAPGVLAMTGSSGAVYPEDLNEAGTLWDHFERNKVDFFNFGFGLDQVNTIEDMAYKHTGERYTVNYPVPAPLHERSSDQYATWNMAIPDQYRMDMFIKEFREKWMGTGKSMPQVLTVYLPNDHGAGPRPAAGYPLVESYMMDNDLALGRLVDFLSHTPYWKNMAIMVTEDDPQGGVDHVDAHRSIAMVISPYAKRGYVSHVHTSFGSIMKTMWNVLGIPYLNHYDAAVTDLADCFTDAPDLTPYVVQLVDTDIFDPQKALTPLDENFDWEALYSSPELDDPETMQEWSEADREERGRMAAIVFPPVIEPDGGTFTSSRIVSIRKTGPAGTVHFTTDGSAPDASSTVYTAPFTVTKTTTVRAVTIGRDGKTSRMKSAVFTKSAATK